MMELFERPFKFLENISSKFLTSQEYEEKPELVAITVEGKIKISLDYAYRKKKNKKQVKNFSF